MYHTNEYISDLVEQGQVQEYHASWMSWMEQPSLWKKMIISSDNDLLKK